MRKSPSRRAVLLAGAAMVVVCLLASCLPVPLGDPASARVDARYTGAWTWSTEQERHVVLMRPWDERTYILQMHTLRGGGDEWEVETLLMKGWLAEVKGQTFLSLQQVETLVPLPGEKVEKVYLVAKLELVNQRLLATPLNPGFELFKIALTAEELQRQVEANFDNPEIWTKPIEARLMTAEELAAFNVRLETLRKRAGDAE